MFLKFVIYFLSTERDGRTGIILPEVFLVRTERSEFSTRKTKGNIPQCSPELVRVNKKFIIWLCLTLYQLKSEPWRIGVNETVYRKTFKLSCFISHKKFMSYKKKKNFQRNCLFSFSFKSLQLFESNVLSHFLYFRFTSRALTSLIMPVGITGKSSLEYWPITVRVIYLQAVAI